MQDKNKLFKKYINNECSSDDIRELLRYFEQADNNSELEFLIKNQLSFDVEPDLKQKESIEKHLIKVDAELKQKLFNQPRKIKLQNFIKYAVAACLILVASVSFVLVFLKDKKSNHPVVNLNSPNIDRDKATLKLADGSIVDVSSNHADVIVNKNSVKIFRTDDGTLTYSIASNDKVKTDEFNELATPKGAKIKVLLPDGTKVWLNAESSIKYPVSFSSNERVVELSGEAYFEVEKLMVDNTRVPFKVKTPTQMIEVLGTEFNVNSYPDQDFTKTTLIGGKVNVSVNKTSQQFVLMPGEQIISKANGNAKTISVNPENSIAWKNGNFMFDDEKLSEILKQFARWYNVEVDFSTVPDTHYNMLISRNESLRTALHMLEKTGHIKFNLINNKVIIVE